MNTTTAPSKPLLDYISSEPLTFPLPSGGEAWLERAKTATGPTHFVLYMPPNQETKEPAKDDTGELLQLSYEIAQLLAEDHFGDPECFTLTLNGSRTGSWQNVRHVNFYLHESREAKLREYHDAVTDALKAGI